MKKLILIIIILAVTFPISAQVIREARVYVPPVAGHGRISDKAFFYRQLTSEVVFQYYALVRSQRVCDYILRAVIVPYGVEEPEGLAEPKSPIPNNPLPPVSKKKGVQEYFSWELGNNIHFYNAAGEDNYSPNNEITPEEQFVIADDQEFSLKLELINNVTGEILGKQQLVFTAADASVGDLLSIQVYNMLAGIPDIEETYDWRDKWLFLEASFLWAPRVYTQNNPSINWQNFGLRAAFEFHFTDFMSFGLGTQFVQDWVVTSKSEHRDLILEIPLSIKGVFKTAEQFVIEPYAGLALNFSLMNATIPSAASWFLGLQFGVKAGPGMIVIDPRFSMDFEKSRLVGKDNIYQRDSMQIGVGYKIGFILKRSVLDY